MSPVDLSSYKSLFIHTAKEFLENLKKNLNLLQQNTTDKTAIYEIFRSAHTIKGQCLTMRYPKTAQLAKTIEDTFHKMNDGTLAFSPDMIPVISKTISSIEQSIHNIEKNNNELDLSFTLIELVVVVGIVAILLAITLILLQSPK